jgi:PEP-CTERM motif
MTSTACKTLSAKSNSFQMLILTAAIALFALCATRSMRADTLTYDVTLTPGNGSTIGGTGVITLNGATPAASGVTDYTVANGGLQNLTFSIDGESFNLAGAQGNALVEFTNGVLTDITFSEEIGTNPYMGDRFALHTSGVYAFYYNNEQSQSDGTFTGNLVSDVSAVPEPSSLALFGTGVLGVAGAFRRRFAGR